MQFKFLNSEIIWALTKIGNNLLCNFSSSWKSVKSFSFDSFWWAWQCEIKFSNPKTIELIKMDHFLRTNNDQRLMIQVGISTNDQRASLKIWPKPWSEIAVTYPVSCSNSPGDFGGPLAFCHGEFEQEGVWRKEEVGGPRLRSIFVLKKRFENFISHYQAHQKLSNEKLFTDFHD